MAMALMALPQTLPLKAISRGGYAGGTVGK